MTNARAKAMNTMEAADGSSGGGVFSEATGELIGFIAFGGSFVSRRDARSLACYAARRSAHLASSPWCLRAIHAVGLGRANPDGESHRA
jgi:hypothetical protein